MKEHLAFGVADRKPEPDLVRTSLAGLHEGVEITLPDLAVGGEEQDPLRVDDLP